MSITINAIPGDPNANSYCTLAFANSFIDDQQFYAKAQWDAIAVDDQSRLLIWATYFLDQMVDWKGYKAGRDQKLRWPRSGVLDQDYFFVDYNTVPEQIQKITAQTAFEFAKQNRVLEPGTLGQGIDDVTVGPIHIHINTSLTLPFWPSYLSTMIENWGVIRNKGGPGGMGMSKLIRV